MLFLVYTCRPVYHGLLKQGSVAPEVEQSHHCSQALRLLGIAVHLQKKRSSATLLLKDAVIAMHNHRPGLELIPGAKCRPASPGFLPSWREETT